MWKFIDYVGVLVGSESKHNNTCEAHGFPQYHIVE